jgi:hypothetical protein
MFKLLPVEQCNKLFFATDDGLMQAETHMKC